MNLHRLTTLLGALICLIVSANAAEKYDFVVAQDGSGDFTTVQAAINAVPEMRTARTRIHIKPGKYKEKITLPTNKTNVTLIGDCAYSTTLTYDDYASKQNRFGENIGTSGSSSFFVFGDGFTAENITFENSSGPVGQAVAVRIDGDKVCFRNCRFLGFQDTLYPHGEKSRQYYQNCYIEGTVDFIFGFSTAFFEECSIVCKTNGYVTAASTPQGNAFGFVFQNCTISGDAPDGSFYLGRPWRPYAQVVFRECTLGKVINPKGWDNWGKTENEQTAFFAEYKNKGEGAITKNRVPWSKQLTDKEAEKYTKATLFGDWNPDIQ